MPRLRGQGAQGAGRVAQACRARGHRAVQHEHAHVGARVACGQRLAVGPDAQHGIVGARIDSLTIATFTAGEISSTVGK